ncbi:response regulator transcription factor [Bacillus sp. CGMCC 1.16607]|uniref:response regulator transcription factor n=1 Tax=Bacillus sp. CGMCC 1.16607 TaxID=3351842 RepID=UPI003642A70B
MSVHILLAEDDSEIARIVCDHLRRKGYLVTWASSGKEGWEDFQQGDYHLVMVDLMLPEMDGFQLVKHVRLQSDIPILILSAKVDEDDKVRGLKDGADDYLTKPFSLRELEARVESLLRRYQRYYDMDKQLNDQVLTFQPGLIVDLQNKNVKVDQKEISLTVKEFDLLVMFIKHPGRVFSKKEIYEHIWNQVDVDGNNTVTVHIKSLRTKLNDSIRNPVYIQTAWGVGYRFIGVNE